MYRCEYRMQNIFTPLITLTNYLKLNESASDVGLAILYTF